MARRSHWKSELALVAATFTAYAHVGRNGFVWDDAFLTERNPYLSVDGVGKLLTSDLWVASAKEEPSFYYRPLAAFSFAVNKWIGGNSAASYHFGNVLLHALVAVLVARAVRALHPKTTGAIPWLAGLCFALLPVDSEAVVWIAGRFDLLGAAFALWAMAEYARRRTWSVLVAYAGAVFSKESFLVLPLAFVAIDWARGERPTKQAATVFPLSALTAATYLLVRRVLHVPIPPTAASLGPVAAMQSYATSIWTYAVVLFDPAQVSLFHVYRPLPIAAALAVTLVLAAITIALVRLRRTRHASVRGALAMWLTFLFSLVPVGLTAPVHFQLGDRYAYFPVACLLVMIACLVDRVAPRGRARGALAVAMLAVAAVSVPPLERRIREWHSSRELFTVELARDPSRYWARQMLGEMLATDGRYSEAEAELLRARRDALTTHYRIDVALCYVYLNENRLDAAVSSCRLALAEFPVDPRAWVNLANAYLLEGHDDDALAAATNASRYKPHYAEAAYIRAAALHGLGRDDEARAAVNEALQYDPSHARARRLAQELAR